VVIPSSVVDHAYLAGIVDGEGCIIIRHQGGRKGTANGYALELNITNTDEALMIWLLDTFGGLCRWKVKKGLTGLMKRPSWVWWVSGKNAGAVLQVILPYLRVKRAQADLGLRFLSHGKGRCVLTGRGARLDPKFLAERATMKTHMQLLKAPRVATGSGQ